MEKETKYENASQDPMYWGLTIGLFIFGLLTKLFSDSLYSAINFSFIGVILYILVFKEKRLIKN